jgi:hypothetical protein
MDRRRDHPYEHAPVQCPRQSWPTVLNGQVGSSSADGDEVTDHLGIDTRCDNDVRSEAPQTVGTRDPGDIEARLHPDELRRHSRVAERLVMPSAITQRGYVRIQPAVLKRWHQKRELALCTADGEGSAQEEDAGQATASS